MSGSVESETEVEDVIVGKRTLSSAHMGRCEVPACRYDVTSQLTLRSRADAHRILCSFGACGEHARDVRQGVIGILKERGLADDVETAPLISLAERIAF